MVLATPPGLFLMPLDLSDYRFFYIPWTDSFVTRPTYDYGAS